MFDLDIIEKDWKENSFYLSDDEIMQIYIQEGITTKELSENMKAYFSMGKISAEDRLFATMFDDEEEKEKIEKANEKRTKYLNNILLNKKKLSNSSQMKIVEGCMDVVFKKTREWYITFDGNISMEKLYYICLDSLFNSVKYCIHYSTKPCFRLYVEKSIERNIIKMIARKEHISYKNAYCIIFKLMNHYDNIDKYEKKELEYGYDREIPYKPSRIYELVKNERYDEDYIKNISSEDFMLDYNKALSELSDKECEIMSLLYDMNGKEGLTYKEIYDFLGIKPSKIRNIKKRVKIKLKSDERFDKYRY